MSEEIEIVAEAEPQVDEVEKEETELQATETEIAEQAQEEQAPLSESEQGKDTEKPIDTAELERELEKEREARLLCENKLLCMGLLEENGMPRELCDYLTVSDEGETRKRVECVSKIIKSAINEGVSQRLATIKSPTQGKNEMTKKEFKGLSLADMQRLYKTDRELYKQLTNKN